MHRLYLAHGWVTGLSPLPGFRLLHSYPEMALVECAEIPATLPAGQYNLVDDTRVVVNGQTFEVPERVSIFEDTPRHLVRFIGPVATDWIVSLNHVQVKAWFWCPPYGACMEIPSSLKNDAFLERFPFIAGIVPYQESQCTRHIDMPSESLRKHTGVPAHVMDLVCFSREDRYRIETQLAQQGTNVLSASSSKIRIQYDGDPKILRELNGVKLVDHARAPLLTHVSLPEAVGAVDPVTASAELTGAGQVIAVADTGLDTGTNDDGLHEDLRGRVRQILSWPINTAWTSFVNNPQSDDGAEDVSSGHGTHVAGLALGNGNKSQGKYRGVAPQAQLVFQAIEQFTDVKLEYQSQMASGYYLSGKPMDLRKLFTQAHDLGAKIHVNAWGDPAQGKYTDDSFEADMFLHEHPDNIVLFASGNSGADENGDRLLDKASLYAPASAKNVVAIGATEGSNIGVGLRASWSAFDQNGNRFANALDRSDSVSGHAEQIALFTSTGPTVDGRIKPDVCAPGTNLAAPRSSRTEQRAWGMASPMPYYMYNGGTSMAVGVAGGAVALLREAWQKHLGGRAPSGVALKALLIFGAKPVINRATNAPEPRHVAGFGRIQVNGSVPSGTIKLHDEVGNGLSTGEQREVVFNHPQNSHFRAVLTWYDPPGERLINDLDLCLIDAHGNTLWGNHAAGETGTPDRINNLEVIDAPSLPAGQYRLRVIAHNVPAGPQDYALAATIASAAAAVTAPTKIPVHYIKGIGATYKKRLLQHDVQSVSQLLALQRDTIDTFTQMPTGTLDLVLARCAVLRQVVRELQPAVSAEAAGLTVFQILFDAKPETVTADEFARLQKELMSLLLVFNKSVLKKIKIHELL